MRSIKGRDKDILAVVLSVDDKGIYIADGKVRKTAEPKLKNPKHIEATEYLLDEYDISFDSRLRKKLNRIRDNY